MLRGSQHITRTDTEVLQREGREFRPYGNPLRPSALSAETLGRNGGLGYGGNLPVQQWLGSTLSVNDERMLRS